MGLAALLALALGAGVGCSRGEGNASVAGTTFPPLDGATVQLLDARALDALPIILPELARGSLAAGGVFGPFPLGKFTGGLVVRTIGGTFLDPATQQPVALSPVVDAQGFPEDEFDLLLGVSRGQDVSGAVISPLSHLAAMLGAGLRLQTGASVRAAARRAAEALSLYLGEDRRLVPFTQGVVLWDPAAPHGGTELSSGVRLGLVVAALSVRASLLGVDLESYVSVLALDVGDGRADGLVHPPFASAVGEVTGLAGYPDDPLGRDLAGDVEAFLAGPTNESALTVTAAADLLERLRAGRGLVLPEVPFIDAVVSPQLPGQRVVTIEGGRFEAGAQVRFDGVAAPFADVVSATRLRAELPADFASGSTVFVTVQNPDGLRGSRRATITLP
ncbi:MAG: hypothetical protein KatS3mg102_0517 [Planctomycetota bacterium]|nr:MAG: hypothetical protein KatS3mg102_0517 [Planctomycetota bacterium]